MIITNIQLGQTFINASIPNIFVLSEVDNINKVISISRSSASSLALISNDSEVSISVEKPLKAAIYSSQIQ